MNVRCLATYKIGRIIGWIRYLGMMVGVVGMLLGCKPAQDEGNNSIHEVTLPLLTMSEHGWQVQGISVGMLAEDVLVTVEQLPARERQKFSRYELSEEGYELSWIDDTNDVIIGLSLSHETVSSIDLRLHSDIATVIHTLGQPDAYIALYIGFERQYLHSIQLVFSEEGIVTESFVDTPDLPLGSLGLCEIAYREQYPVRRIFLVPGGETQTVVDQLRQPIRVVGQWLPWRPDLENLQLLDCDK